MKKLYRRPSTHPYTVVSRGLNFENILEMAKISFQEGGIKGGRGQYKWPTWYNYLFLITFRMKPEKLNLVENWLSYTIFKNTRMFANFEVWSLTKCKNVYTLQVVKNPKYIQSCSNFGKMFSKAWEKIKKY